VRGPFLEFDIIQGAPGKRNRNMEYKIVTKFTKEELEKRINFDINTGWKLQGGICIAFSLDGSIFYCQALTFDLPKRA